MSPLAIVCMLGRLCTECGRLSVERHGSWTAAWMVGGRIYAHATATSPDAAIEALSADMIEAADREAAAYQEQGTPDCLEVAEAIRLALASA